MVAQSHKLRTHVKRRRSRRDVHWPDAEDVVFDRRGGGWVQMPRTVPMIAALLDTAPFGGKQPPGSLYVALWGSEFGDGMVEINDPAMLALESGYTARRGERNVAERIRVLAGLGFLRAASVGLREFGVVLLLDPHQVLMRIRKDDPSRIADTWWHAFVAKCASVGIALESDSDREARRALDEDEDVDEEDDK